MNFIKYLLLTVGLLLLTPGNTEAQVNFASPVNWLYPSGNPEATKHVSRASSPQEIDSMVIKWTTPSISGDVTPLIGNIINDGKLINYFPYAPNEMAAVMGDEIVVVDARGRTHSRGKVPPYVNNISMLFDSTSGQIAGIANRPVVMGLETMEYENVQDTLAFGYIAGFNHDADTAAILMRLAIDLRPYKPNIFSSVKPLFAKRSGSEMLIYAAVNISQPQVNDSMPAEPPYLRGLTQFNTGTVLSNFPFYDVGDDEESRITLGPEVNFAPPSLAFPGGVPELLLPSYPSPSINTVINNPVTDPTRADEAYLTGFDLSGTQISAAMAPRRLDSLLDTAGTRARIRPYHVNIRDAATGDSMFVLVAEEYLGIEGSSGRSRLHLFDTDGNPVTLPGDTAAPPFIGSSDHLWSIAVGNIDGNATNEDMPFYPNNPGNEIIATQSSGEFAFASSRLFIMRYNSGPRVEKPTPPGDLFHFDTIATQRINGWVAAVNDLDNSGDGKEEILLVDGSKLMAVRMRDYDDYMFRIGRPFDTVMSYEFRNQTISAVAVSDMEGDGLNDIIVTTFDSTYVIGNLLTDIMTFNYPVSPDDDGAEFCAGDTIRLEWENFVAGQYSVSILFEKIENNAPADTIVIEDDFPNESDTVIYNYVADDPLPGSTGRFIVRSNVSPDKIAASSATVTIVSPDIVIDQPANDEYFIGDILELTGQMNCVDSVLVEYSYRTGTFTPADPQVFSLTSSGVNSALFTAETTVPSATFFNCRTADSDSLLFFRVRGIKDGHEAVSDVLPLKIRPLPLAISWEEPETACPSILFEWNRIDLLNSCANMQILLSTDFGNSFSEVETVASGIEEYRWMVPTTLPDEIMMRFCCDNSFMRRDTVISDYKPEYIDIIAPNPFNPVNEELEIVYEVPEDTRVTIKIYDAADRLVSIPVQGQQRISGQSYCDRWDGRRFDGNYAANGTYYISFEMSGGSREIYRVFVRK